ncbi:hypothetical protein L911_2887 [Vibrio fluvialis I21563]|nr:hypothetical protein L911_2887 [Vibrio fluvialis I21563]
MVRVYVESRHGFTFWVHSNKERRFYSIPRACPVLSLNW